VLAVPARTVDVAPTVGALFGLAAPSGGYDGTARTEAFSGPLVLPPGKREAAGR
jgi:hypothetical protein